MKSNIRGIECCSMISKVSELTSIKPKPFQRHIRLGSTESKKSSAIWLEILLSGPITKNLRTPALHLFCWKCLPSLSTCRGRLDGHGQYVLIHVGLGVQCAKRDRDFVKSWRKRD